MKRLCATALLLLWGLCAFAVQKSETIVYINGSKFYVHTVQPGETLYALSKEYGVGEQAILQHNPAAASGLKVNENLRIPFVATATPKISDKKLRREFNIHTVVRGETLYSISRMFEIPIPTIVEDNPNLDPIHLKLGQTVLIRKKQVGSEDEAGSRKQWEQYRQTLNSVTEPGYAYHIVNPGETFYSLSHRFGITELQLSELNGGLKAYDLKAGAMLKIPAPASTAEADTSLQPQVAEPETPKATRVEFQPLREGEVLNVSLLLPLMSGNNANNNYLEFYQGFLLGLDSVRQNNGHSVKLSLYNTSRDPERVREIVEGDEAFGCSNLIVGPVYEETLYPVVSYAEQRGIPIVSPLASLSKIGSGVLFQMAPDPVQKYRKVANLLEAGKRITLIYSNSTDKDFEQEIKTLLGDRKYEKHTYRYEHASRAGAASDLTSLLDNGDDNVFILLSDNETEVDRILAAMASADTSITSRGRTTPRFTVLGNARWNRYNNIDRTMFFKDRVVFISTYHAKRDAEAVAAFDAAYLRAFGALPTLYSYRGYDAAMIFTPAMYNDIQYNMSGRSYTPLQTSYVFERDSTSGNNINTNWMRVNYNSDFTITIE